MSKERLEKLNEMRIDRNVNFTDTYYLIIYENITDEFDWLIEQAELYRETRADAIELYRENNHYRERLEYMLAEAKDHKKKGLRIQHWALIKDLEQTLEESK